MSANLKEEEETRRAAGKTCIRKSTLVEICEDEFKCCSSTIIMGTCSCYDIHCAKDRTGSY